MRWIGYLLLLIPLTLWANCDLATYRWGCDMVPRLKPGKNLTMAFCNGTPVFLTPMQVKIMKRYAHSHVIMVLKIDGEYFTGPCKLASK